MSVAGGGLAGLEELWVTRRPRTPGGLVGVGVALGLHLVIGGVLARVDVSILRGEQTVEMEVRDEPPPPPPEVREEPPPPAPPPPEAKPRVVMRHVTAQPTPPTEAPPPPSEATPPKASDAPPVFGVSLDSTVSGDGPGMAVPVGNTLMTKPHKAAAPAGPLGGADGDPDRLPAPVPEIMISEQVKVIHEVQAAYPPEVQRMGIEGVVVAKLYVDDKGDVRRVTIIEKAGHGFDDLAREALKKFKFSPARTSDGKAVPTNIVYKYRFELPQ